MSKRNGSQTVDVIPGRRIIFSKGVGNATTPDIQWLEKTILAQAALWKATGWAYIADCSEMAPVAPAENMLIVEMTKKIVASNCKVLAFVDGKSILLKAQSKKNTENAKTGVPQEHFATKEEALAWLQKNYKI